VFLSVVVIVFLCRLTDGGEGNKDTEFNQIMPI